MSRWPIALAIVLCGCAAVFGIPSDVELAGGDAGLDAADAAMVATDAPVFDDGVPRACDPTKDFGAPVVVEGISSKDEADRDAFLSDDELTIWFAAVRSAVNATFDLYTATRTDPKAAFGSPLRLDGPINTETASELKPTVSADGLSIVFSRQFFMSATRAATTDPFSGFKNVSNDSFTSTLTTPFVRPTAPTELWYAASPSATEPGLYDLMVGPLASAATATAVPNVNVQGKNELAPVISADGRTLYFAREHDPDAQGKRYYDTWMSRRDSRTATFQAPVPLTSLKPGDAEDVIPTWISPDECRLYVYRVTAQTSGTDDILVATRPL